jgi:hypothetical protein
MLNQPTVSKQGVLEPSRERVLWCKPVVHDQSRGITNPWLKANGIEKPFNHISM